MFFACLDTHKIPRTLTFKEKDNPRMKTGSARLGDYLVLRILRVSNFCMSKIYIKEPLNKEQNDGRIDIIQYIGGMTGKRIDRITQLN